MGIRLGLCIVSFNRFLKGKMWNRSIKPMDFGRFTLENVNLISYNSQSFHNVVKKAKSVFTIVFAFFQGVILREICSSLSVRVYCLVEYSNMSMVTSSKEFFGFSDRFLPFEKFCTIVWILYILWYGFLLQLVSSLCYVLAYFKFYIFIGGNKGQDFEDYSTLFSTQYV